ncbi:hypothetical protein [Vibrio sp. AND4]|uniref:hypothetical protein n=1 Tax=Vibrio sp. AND4 TaxID=314289 RepID=UPI000A030F7D
MDNPKTFILVFVSALIALCLTLWLTSSGKTQTISAEVISNTLTLSLDGQRRYLTIKSGEIGTKRVAVPASVSCPEGARATFSQVTNSLFEQSLIFLNCE